MEFSWGTLTVMAGFTLLLVLEAAVLGEDGHGQGALDHAGHSHGVAHSHAHGHGVEGSDATTAHQHVHVHACATGEVAAAAATALGMRCGPEEGKGEKLDAVVPIGDNPMHKASESSTSAEGLVSGEDVKSAAAAPAPLNNARTIARAWVFFIALSVHSFLDGMSVGTATDPAVFASTVAAVVFHKMFDGIALGIPVYASGMPWKSALAALSFCALMTPVGIAVGLGASEGVAETPSAYLASGVILGLSGGSYLYVALTELLPTALADGKARLPKLAVFTVAWVLMAILGGYA